MRRIVLRAFTAFAYFLFLVSVFLPFLSVHMFSIVLEVKSVVETCWSFKLTTAYQWWRNPNTVTRGEGYSFVDYWNYMRPDHGVWEGIMILLFATQILTALSASAAICLRDRVEYLWLLSASINSAVGVFCMWIFAEILQNHGVQSIGFERGFWLALASAVLFMLLSLSL